MKTKSIVLAILIFLSYTAFSQFDSKILKAVEKIYNDAEDFYKKENYQEAVLNYQVVLDKIYTIPSESKKHVYFLLNSELKLIEIYFNYLNNLSAGCEVLERFNKDVDLAVHQNLIKGKDIKDFLVAQKRFESELKNCQNYNSIDLKKNEMEKKFDKEFKDDDTD
ncbi:MAG: hypothetical protein WHW07_07630 [Bacteroidales bacterium]|jgi:Leucine-rich repeat (LRR) protein